jgi:hypothetical protein
MMLMLFAPRAAAGGEHGRKWQDCKAYATYEDMLASDSKPDIAFVGVPPKYYGALDDARATLEVQPTSLCYPLSLGASCTSHVTSHALNP